MRIRCMMILIACLSGAGLVGCGSAPRHETPPTTEKQLPKRVRLDDAQAVRGALLAQHSHWQGVPYRLGGETRRGLDCSAFVQLTFRDLFGISLPRQTSSQREAGKLIALEQVAAGDLLFFRTGAADRHVGMYIGGGRFLHVSTSSGVMISSMDEGYWRARLSRVVRIRP